MKEKLKISLIQFDIKWLKQSENFEYLSQKLDLVANSDIVFLPEMFDTGFCTQPQRIPNSKNNLSYEWLKKTVSDKKISLGGSTIFYENDCFYNRFFLINSEKDIYFYNKRHLFSLANETNNFVAGTQPTVANHENWKINLQVCYDLRFPVWSRNTNDYHVLVYVANWPTSRIAQWKALLVARAIENQCYTIGVNRIGQDGNGFNYCGNSLIINPKGEIMVETKENQEDICSAVLDFNYLNDSRKKFPVLRDADIFCIT